MKKVFQKRLSIALCFSVLGIGKAVWSQELDHVNYSAATRAIDFLSNTAVFVLVPRLNQSGTGIMILLENDTLTHSGWVYLLTNRHNFEKTDDQNRVQKKVTEGKVILQRRGFGKDTLAVSVADTAWPTEDVLLLNIANLDTNLDVYESIPLTMKHIGPITELRRGQTAYIVGYPLGLGTKGKKLNPIAQSGIIAQVDPESNVVLVDISINHGTSGSPVYYVGDNGMKLLGLAFAYPINQDRVLKRSTPGYNLILDTLKTRRDSVFVLHRDSIGYSLVGSNSSLAMVVPIYERVKKSFELLMRGRISRGIK